MPAYLVIHPRDQRRDDMLIEDDNLTLTFQAGWPSSATATASASPSPAGKAPASNASTPRSKQPSRSRR